MAGDQNGWNRLVTDYVYMSTERPHRIQRSLRHLWSAQRSTPSPSRAGRAARPGLCLTTGRGASGTMRPALAVARASGFGGDALAEWPCGRGLSAVVVAEEF